MRCGLLGGRLLLFVLMGCEVVDGGGGEYNSTMKMKTSIVRLAVAILLNEHNACPRRQAVQKGQMDRINRWYPSAPSGTFVRDNLGSRFDTLV